MKTVPVPTSADVISGMKPNSIAAKNPALAAQMVTAGPNASDPALVTTGSRKAVWWDEHCGHGPYQLAPDLRKSRAGV